MVSTKKIRNYEVSIWTLQDSFITVLKPFNLEHKGTIQDGKVILQDDGENKISFSLPMYIRENGQFVENPLWYNRINGNLIANLRKLKVIFNKKTEDEEIFEFIITKVTEKHDGFSKLCEVEGEGLAFNELGKQGYKIVLSAEDLYLEAQETEGSIIKNNINYWCDKVFKDSNWRYSIQMDWSASDGVTPSKKDVTKYSDLTEDDRNDLNNARENLGLRRRDTVYEDAYIPSWEIENNSLVASAVIQEAEKFRIVEGSESNRYNLIQTIAETFGVFTKFKYYYDETYHIVDREVIFYNNFLNEDEVIDLSFNYETQSISRELDSTEIVTKMYVRSLDDSSSPSGLVSIADTAANKSREDYLLNFDYLYSTNTISDEQYAAIKTFETNMGRLNKAIIKLDEEIIQLEADLLEAEIKRDTAASMITEASETIYEGNEVIDNITGGSGVLKTTVNNPGYILLTKNKNGTYTGKFGNQYTGVLKDSLQIYKTFSSGEIDANSKLNFIVKGKGKIAESVIINQSAFGNDFDGTHCYGVFEYQPDLVRKQTIDEYQTLVNKNQKIYDKEVKKIDGDPEASEGTKKNLGLQRYLDQQKAARKEKLEEKNSLISQFENMMGPAQREGTWQPEDEYSQYGEQNFELIAYNLEDSEQEISDKLSFIWDNELFDEEEENFTYEGITQTKVYYPCIDLSENPSLLAALANKDFLNNLVFSYQKKEENQNIVPIQVATIGNNCRLGFIRAKTGGNIKPVLMILSLEDYRITASNAENIMEEIEENLINLKISYLQINRLLDDNSLEPENGEIFPEDPEEELVWIDNPTQYEIVYPRLKIKSNYLKTGANELSLYTTELLSEFEDYYISSRDNSKYITLKNETLFKHNFGQIGINYFISNAALQVYLDAINVMKENAYPKVSYTINDLSVNSNILYNDYNRLGQLAHINDAELKFNGAMGYISAVELNLDKPWEDAITIKNYKNKFEDLFSTIVAQTEEMKKNAYRIGMAAGSFLPNGQLNALLSANALNASRRGLNGIISQNANLIAAQAIGEASKNKALLASTNAYRVMNGEMGLAFTSPVITNLEINQEKGLLIEGKAPGTSVDVFFNVTNERMGFYKGTYEDRLHSVPLLHFENGDLALAGNIYAKNGWFGSNRGWIIGEGNTGANKGEMVPRGDSQSKTISDSDLGGLLYSANGKMIFASGTDTTDPLIVLSSAGFTNVSDGVADTGALFVFKDGQLYIKGTIYATGLQIAGSNNDGFVSLENYLSNSNLISELKSQIDGEIDTWFKNGTPGPLESDINKRIYPNGVGNSLEEEWGITWDENNGYSNSDLNKIYEHSSDIYYDKIEGNAYRFIVDGENYYWKEIGDSSLSAALIAVQNATEAMDGKIACYLYTGTIDPPTAVGGGIWIPQRNGSDVTLSIGDLAIATNLGNKMFRYSSNGTWESIQDNSFMRRTEFIVDGTQGTIKGEALIATEDGKKVISGTQMELNDNGKLEFSSITGTGNLAQLTMENGNILLSSSNGTLGDSSIKLSPTQIKIESGGVIDIDSVNLIIKSNAEGNVNIFRVGRANSSAYITYSQNKGLTVQGGIRANKLEILSNSEWVEISNRVTSIPKTFTGSNNPTPPYSAGDIWVQGSTGDIYYCYSSRTSGNYNSSDWRLASNNSSKANVYTGNPNTVSNKKNGDLLISDKSGEEGRIYRYVEESNPHWIATSAGKIIGTKLQVDPDEGNIVMTASNKITIAADQKLQLLTNGYLEIAGNKGVTIASNSQLTILSGGQIDIESPNFIVKSHAVENNLFRVGSLTGNYFAYNASGILTIKGKIITGSGEIGGWTIDSDKLYSGSGSNYVALSTGGDYRLWVGNEDASQATFRIKQNGNFFVGNSTNYLRYTDTSGLVIQGNITATSGKIGNWKISNDKIYSGSNTNYVALSTGTYYIWAGSEEAANATFRVKQDGTFFVGNSSGYLQYTSTNGLEIKGKIVATLLDLGNNQISYAQISNRPDLNIYIAKDGTIGDISENGTQGFKVGSDGLLTAKNAVIHGTIYASSGTIGGWTINSALLQSTDGKILLNPGASSSDNPANVNAFRVNDTNNNTIFAIKGNGDFSAGTALSVKNGKISDFEMADWRAVQRNRNNNNVPVYSYRDEQETSGTAWQRAAGAGPLRVGKLGDLIFIQGSFVFIANDINVGNSLGYQIGFIPNGWGIQDANTTFIGSWGTAGALQPGQVARGGVCRGVLVGDGTTTSTTTRCLVITDFIENDGQRFLPESEGLINGVQPHYWISISTFFWRSSL